MNNSIHEIACVGSLVTGSVLPGSVSSERDRKFAATAATVAFCIGLVSCGGDNSNQPVSTPVTIQTLSNRADLISGGSALVEVKLPSGASVTKLKVDRDGTDVTAAFTTLPSGRTLGVVSGLKNGTNNLNATSTDNSFPGARLVITDYPIGGPVLLSAQTTPWICATPVPVAQSGNTPASNAMISSLSASFAGFSLLRNNPADLKFRRRGGSRSRTGKDCRLVYDTPPNPEPGA